MLHPRTQRCALVLAVGLPLLAASLSAPAAAAPPNKSGSTTSGGQAFAQWTEYDAADALRLPGNVHVGFLGVYQQPGFTDVFGTVEDYACGPGQVPGGGHGEPGEGLCKLIGTRFLSGNGTTTFSVDVKAGVARLTGTLDVGSGGHGEPGQVLGQPKVDMTWTAVGGTYRFSRTETWSDGSTGYRSKVRGTGFEAAISGAIGPMGFADDVDDESYGNSESWREMSRSRMR